MTAQSDLSPSRSLLPLSLASPGQNLRIVEIQQRESVRQRLAALGLSRGASIRILQSNPGSPLIVAVKSDSRLVIGLGTAHHILVTQEQ